MFKNISKILFLAINEPSYLVNIPKYFN